MERLIHATESGVERLITLSEAERMIDFPKTHRNDIIGVVIGHLACANQSDALTNLPCTVYDSQHMDKHFDFLKYLLGESPADFGVWESRTSTIKASYNDKRFALHRNPAAETYMNELFCGNIDLTDLIIHLHTLCMKDVGDEICRGNLSSKEGSDVLKFFQEVVRQGLKYQPHKWIIDTRKHGVDLTLEQLRTTPGGLYRFDHAIIECWNQAHPTNQKSLKDAYRKISNY